MPSEPHASLEELTAFSLGQLQGPSANQVENHVSACDQCCQTLLDLTSQADTFVQLLQVARHQPATDSQALTRDADVVRTAAEQPDLPPALLDHPRYRVVEQIGVGGMGNVYRAEHRMMERTVALKVIHRQLVTNAQAVERFHREVKAAARLSHVNIVAALDAERAGDAHFLIMEYVKGVNLAQVVASQGQLAVGQACDFIRQAARGLQHAHLQGMVHRDIKPHNLMLTDDGIVKILDFGLASLTTMPLAEAETSQPRNSALTDAGAIMGTPDYISPEQVADARAVDGRSDIYSLGATFYFLLAGRPPFATGSVSEILDRHARQDAEPIDQVRTDVPTALAQVITRMLAKNPDDRFQTATELGTALEPFVTPHDVDRPPRAAAPQRIRWLAAAVAACLLVATTWGAVVAWRGPQAARQRGPIAQETLPAQVGTRDDASANDPPSVATTSSPDNPQNDIPPEAARALEQMQFVAIPAGEFTMGTPVISKATPSERRHQVTITEPFAMGACEVTQQEYAWVMGQNPSAFASTGRHSAAAADVETNRLPVENVSWEDATEFCRRLTALPESQRAGYVYRLPTEAEWELACRGGTTTTYHAGEALNGTWANVDGDHPWGTQETGPSLQRTAPVGSYDPNPWGLYDMHGNVWEWCADWYALDYYDDSPANDPTGPTSGTTRVVRGGSWDWGALYARSAAREQRAPNYRDPNLGFRVVRQEVASDE